MPRDYENLNIPLPSANLGFCCQLRRERGLIFKFEKKLLNLPNLLESKIYGHTCWFSISLIFQWGSLIVTRVTLVTIIVTIFVPLIKLSQTVERLKNPFFLTFRRRPKILKVEILKNQYWTTNENIKFDNAIGDEMGSII